MINNEYNKSNFLQKNKNGVLTNKWRHKGSPETYQNSLVCTSTYYFYTFHFVNCVNKYT